MHALSKNKGWTPFNILRTAICLVISIGLSLTCIVSTSPDARTNFMGSPWMLPTITLCYFCVLVLTHIPHPRWGLGKYAKEDYREVSEHKPRELLPTGKGSATTTAPHERVYNRSLSDEYDDDEEEEDDPNNPHRSLRRAQRREQQLQRTGSMRHREKDHRSAGPLRTASHLSDDVHRQRQDTGLAVFDDRRVSLLSGDADRMMSPSPSPPASPPPSSPPARRPSQRRNYR